MCDGGAGGGEFVDESESESLVSSSTKRAALRAVLPATSLEPASLADPDGEQDEDEKEEEEGDEGGEFEDVESFTRMGGVKATRTGPSGAVGSRGSSRGLSTSDSLA